MNEVTIDRGTHLFDPHAHVWGWEISLYLFFAGVTAGILLLTVYLWRRTPERSARSRWSRRLPFAALVSLGAGMAVLFPHLSYKAHAYRFFTTFRPASPMSWEAWLLMLCMPAIALLALSGLTDDESEALAKSRPLAALRIGGLLRWASRLSRKHALGVQRAALAVGLALGAYPGFLLGTLVAHPTWNSAILVPLFVVSALLTGSALMRLFPLSAPEHGFLRRVNLTAIGVNLALLVVFLLWLASGDAAAQAASELFLGGRFTALFWALVVVAGLAVPAIIELTEQRRKLQPTLISPLLLLTGGLCLRLILVAAGQ